MKNKKKIPVVYSTDESINGLGMMMGQYMEQLIEGCPNKSKLAKKLKISTSVEMDKGIASTVIFDRNTIHIKNGVTENTDMHIKSDYMAFANILSGKANPVKQILKGQVKILKHPIKKPIQTLMLMFFLRIPKDIEFDNV